MRAYDFIKQRNILFYWVFIEMRQDKQGRIKKHYINKETDGYIYPDGKRNPTHFLDNMAIIKKQMNYYEQHHEYLKSIAEGEGWKLALMLDTYRIHQIDVDDASFEDEFKVLKDKLPFYKSINKNLAHFFFTTDVVFEGKSFSSYEEGCFDILHGNGSLIDPECIIFNNDKSFEFPDFKTFISQYIMGDARQRRVVNEKHEVFYTDTMETNDLERLVNMLSPDRSSSYKSWISIGLAIKYNDPENGFDVFREFSQKCPEKYDRVECERVWETLRPNGTITLGTIHYLARQDNPEEYQLYFGKTYSRVKKQFEKNHFKLLQPVGYCEVNSTSEEGLIFREENKMYQAYRNMGCYVPTHKKEPYQKFFKIWIDDENIRTYQRLIYQPHPFSYKPQTNPLFFNTFRSYKVYETCSKHQYDHKKGEYGLKLIQQQLRYMSGEEKTEEVYAYHEKWLAQLIQKPQEKGITALVFKSKQGTGKTSFFDYIGTCILGDALYFLSEKYEDLFGNFNPLVKNKLLLAYDEPNGNDTFTNADALKARITGKKVTINIKHTSQETVQDFARLVFLSNNLTPIKKEEDDRRYNCTRCSDEKAKNTEYFNELNSVMDFKNNYENPCKDTMWAVFQWLLTTDISNFDPIHDRPQTKYNSQMISVSPLISFCVALFQNYNETKMLEFTKEELYELFNEYIREKMPRAKPEQYNTFCKKLAEYEQFIIPFGNQRKKVRLMYDRFLQAHPHVISLFSLDYQEKEIQDEEED